MRCVLGITTIGLLLFGNVALAQTDTPLKVTKFHSFNRSHYKVDGRDAWVTEPAESAPGKPWIWRARFPGFHSEVDLELLKRGWHVAFINCDNLYGGPPAMKSWDVMVDFMRKRYDVNPRAVLSGCSRGGLFIYNYANRHPENVAVIYGDTPVLDFRTWPAGGGGSKGSNADWKRLKEVYGFSNDAEAHASKMMPMEYAEKIAAHRIPIHHIIGTNDVIVPPAVNTIPFAERYRKAGGRIVVHATVGPGDGHHIPLDNLQNSVKFIIENTPLPDLPDPVMASWIDPAKGIQNAFGKFATKKKGRVIYLGGSITHGPGWQNMVSDYLKQRFPDCDFEFKNIGIPSLGSNAHAFRWRTDFGGPADLVFFESAVNDNHNGLTAPHIRDAYEGVIRGIMETNPACDIVTLQCAQPFFTDIYRKGENPEIIAIHNDIEKHYGLPSLNFAKEVVDRLDAKQFDWNKDFKNLHPSPFGQRLYYQAIKRFFDTQPNLTGTARSLPKPLSANAWSNGTFLAINKATDLQDFAIDPKWCPSKGGTRAGFVNCPMLVGEKEGASFSVKFDGTVFGLMVAAGHDAGIAEWSVDGGPWKSQSAYTRWSAGLHLPWVMILEEGLPKGSHKITVRIKSESDRSALRIRDFLVNPR